MPAGFDNGGKTVTITGPDKKYSLNHVCILKGETKKKESKK